MSNVRASAAPLITARTSIAVPADRWFFSAMALAVALVVLAGFAPTYYLKGLYGTPTLSPLRHLHGVVFTLWIVLFVVQTALISARRTGLHRRLGIAGGLLAAAMLFVGTTLAVEATRHPLPGVPSGLPPPLVFLVIPLSGLAEFTVLLAAGLYSRRKPDVHKRLMLLATVTLLPAALGRLVFPGGLLDVLGLPVGMLTLTAITALFVGACLIYDRGTRGRVHPASVWGGAFLLGSQLLALVVGGTAAWLTFARWLTR
jgi:hypothetical protein